MEKYGQRVAAARAHVGWSQAKLARELGIAQPSLHELEKGDARGSKHSYKITQLTGVRIEWLENSQGAMISSGASEDPQPFRHAETADLNIQAMPRDVAVLGVGACGEDGLFELQGETLDYLRRPPRLMGVKDAYALYCNNESMVPWRQHGDPVYVNPNQPPKIGDHVVVQLHPDGPGRPIPAYIKKLTKRSAKELVLTQYNPPKDIPIPISKVMKVHRIIDWSELMGF